MLALGEHVGRQVAHDIVYEAAMTAFETRRPLEELLLADEQVMRHLSPEQLHALLRPEAYTGLAGVFVDRVTNEAATNCANDTN